MKTITILLSGLSVLLFVGCGTSQHRYSDDFYALQKAAMERPNRPLIELEAKEGENIILGGVARFAVYAPLQDFAPTQAVRQPGAIEATIRDIAPTALLATGAYLGYRESARTSRHNAALSTQERLGTYRIFGDIATDNGDPLDVTEFLGQAQAGVIAGVNAGGQIAQDSQLVGPINLQPLIDPLPVFIPEP